MKTLEIIEEVSKRVDSIMNDRKRDLESLDGQISGQDAEISAANAEMDKATAAGDLEAFKKAKADRANAMDAKEMYESRKNALENKPLISTADYDRTVAEVCAAVASAESDTKKELTALSDQMASAAAGLEEIATAANNVLARLQHEVYHDADRTRNPKTGEVVPLNHEQKQVNPYGTIHWGRLGIESSYYANYTGNRRAKQ